MSYLNNPNVNPPFLKEDKLRWRVAFHYYNSIGERKTHHLSDKLLNSKRYIETVKGVKKEINKKERIQYANQLIKDCDSWLKTQLFNTETKCFEYADDQDKPFTEFIDEYLTNVKDEGTLTIYTSNANVFKEYLKKSKSEGIKLRDINNDVVTTYLKGFKTISHTNNNLRFLKAVLTYCVDIKHVIDKNPIKGIKAKQVPDSDSNKPYTESQFRNILEVAKGLNYEFYILFLMVYYTLRRPSEILKLQYKNFNFEEGTIYFSGNITKTNKRQTAIPPKFLMDLIKEQLPEGVKPNHYFLGTSQTVVGGDHKTAIFNTNKIPLSFYQDKFKTRAIQNIKKEGQTIYSAKHTGVIVLKKKGYSNQQIMALTGHLDESSLGVYARTYKAEPIERTDNILV